MMIIRPATLRDADTISKNNVLLAEESEHVTLEYTTVLVGVTAVLTDPSKGFFLVAEEKNKIIGQLMITFEWSDWQNTQMWWIQSVYTQKDWRKQGVFSQLLDEIKHRAKKQHVKILRLYTHTTNINAQKAYVAVGWEKKSYFIYQLKD